MKNPAYILLLSLLFSLFVFSGFGKTIEVCQTCSVKTITKAIEQASNGDQILIHEGLYREGNLIINKSLHLKGINLPTLDGQNETEIVTVIADGVTIEGLRIINVGTSYLKDRAGIRVKRSKDFTICDNLLENTFFGIYLEHAKQGTITDNRVLGNAEEEMSSGNAIHLWYSSYIHIENNLLSGHRDGIYLEFVNHSTVVSNISQDNLRYGLHFMFSNDDSYAQNHFRRNGAGVAVMFSRRISMMENMFENNWGKASYGLLLKEIFDATITRNVFRENTIGIMVEGSNRIEYIHNEFTRNGWAIKISGGCLDNNITQNNFLANTFDLSLNSSANNNTFSGNYWTDYSGYDLDRDGIGDVPHRPVKLFNYVVNRTPEAMVLLRSLFVDVINFSEKVSPVFTPKQVADEKPLMKRISIPGLPH